MSDIESWLEQHGLAKYTEVFVENEIEVDDLVHLGEEDLEKLGLPMGPRKRLLGAVASAGTSVDQAGPVPVDETTSLGRASRTGEAERRQLTVMFCDLVGSTALSERMDPEAYREVLAAYQSAAAKAIERYDGYIARYMGDGLLVYFGYPLAHEEDAERAVRAGLGIADAVGALRPRDDLTLQVRIGIATGLVIAGDIVGEGASEERAVLGETPNLAARLQSIARPDAVVVAESTRRLTEGLFVFEGLGPQALKGISAAVTPYRVSRESGAASRFDAAVERGVTRLIGRDAEVSLLLERWGQAKDAEAQLVLLSGEAGIGKSRVVKGFSDAMVGQRHSRVRLYCSPYHQNSALHAPIDQLERVLRFGVADEPPEKLKKLEGVLAELGLELDALVPLLASLLSVPTAGRYAPLELDADQLKSRIFAAWSTMLKAMSLQRPVLVVVEDAHWIDPSTSELLTFALNQLRAARVLVLVTFRPEFEPPWSDGAQVTSLSLNRLGRKEREAIVSEVLGDKRLPREVLDQIVEKTDGIPLYVEELTKDVAESGLLHLERDEYVLTQALPALAIPSSLQDSLMARLDRLSAVKDVAQLASVLGRTFSRAWLAEVSLLGDSELNGALDDLVRAELIYAHGTFPELVYEFKHALVRDAAYQSLLVNTRQQYHGRLARALQETFPATAEVQPELVAYHLTHAGLGEQAIASWQLAATRAAQRAASVEAIGHLAQALEVLKTLPDSEETALLEITLQTALAENMRIVDRFEDALRALDRAESIAEDAGRLEDLAAISYLRGNLYFPTGNVDGCLEQHERARNYARAAASPEKEAQALGGLADAHYMRGRMITAYDHFKQCVELSRKHGFESIEVANHPMQGHARYYQLDLAGALDDAARSARKAESIGQLRPIVVARGLAGMILLEHGRDDEGEEECGRALELARRLGARRFEPWCLLNLGRIRASQGEHSCGLNHLEEAKKICEESGWAFAGPWVLGAEAVIAEDPRRRDAALRKGLELLKRGCVSHNYFYFYRDAIEASLQQEDWDGMARYADALEEYTAAQPLQWTDFFIRRGRALSHVGRGNWSDDDARELERLRAAANQASLRLAIPAISAALERLT